MKRTIAYILISASVALAPLAFTTGCAVTQGRESAKSYAKDKEIVAKIKAAMYADRVVKGTQVDVKSLNGVVQLSGFVYKDEQKSEATELARRVPGVIEVINNISMVPSTPGTATPREVSASGGLPARESSSTGSQREPNPAPVTPAVPLTPAAPATPTNPTTPATPTQQ